MINHTIHIYNSTLQTSHIINTAMYSIRLTPPHTDIDECDKGDDTCDNATTVCVNTIGSYRCQCADGYGNLNAANACSG